MNEPRKLRVFLCHSSQDRPIVRELYQRLLAEEWIDPWLDEEKLIPGQDWEVEIEKAAESTDAVIVFLSNNSLTKEGFVQKELKTVLDVADYKPEGTIFIIPLRIENCQVPRRLRNYQYQDFFKEKDLAYRRLYISLLSRAELIQINVLETIEYFQSQRREKDKKIREETIQKEEEEERIRLDEEETIRKRVRDETRKTLEAKHRKETEDLFSTTAKKELYGKFNQEVMSPRLTHSNGQGSSISTFFLGTVAITIFFSAVWLLPAIGIASIIKWLFTKFSLSEVKFSFESFIPLLIILSGILLLKIYQFISLSNIDLGGYWASISIAFYIQYFLVLSKNNILIVVGAFIVIFIQIFIFSLNNSYGCSSFMLVFLISSPLMYLFTLYLFSLKFDIGDAVFIIIFNEAFFSIATSAFFSGVYKR